MASCDFVFVGGHFLARDENVFTLFEGQEAAAATAAVPQVGLRAPGARSAQQPPGSSADGGPQAAVAGRCLGAAGTSGDLAAGSTARGALLCYLSWECVCAGTQPPNLSALRALQADALLSTLFAQDIEHMPAAITPGRTRSIGPPSSTGNLAALPEGQPAIVSAVAEAPVQQPAAPARAAQQQQQQPPPAQQAAQQSRRRQAGENGGWRQQHGASALPPRNGGQAGGQQGPSLPFPLPPKFLFTCTVGRSMASKARCGGTHAQASLGWSPRVPATPSSCAMVLSLRWERHPSAPAPLPLPLPCSYSLSGSMEVAQLLHKMALADGIPTSQVGSSRGRGCCSAPPARITPPSARPAWLPRPAPGLLAAARACPTMLGTPSMPCTLRRRAELRPV